MAENTNTERAKFEAWALSQKLGEHTDQMGFRYHDAGNLYPAWEAWQARASLPLPAAGQEPVATVFTMEALAPGGGVKYHATIHKPVPAGTKLYAAPQPAVAAGWVKLPGQLPEPGKPVLLDIGKKFPIRAMWAPKFTLPTDGDVDYGEYDEATDDYYCHEGWYEWNEHEDTNWAVSATPRAWAPLPPTSSADSRKGE